MEATEKKPRKRSRKRSREAIAKMVATKKRMRAEREAQQANGEYLPLRVIDGAPEVNDAAEFGAFLGAAWRAYKGM